MALFIASCRQTFGPPVVWSASLSRLEILRELLSYTERVSQGEDVRTVALGLLGRFEDWRGVSGIASQTAQLAEFVRRAAAQGADRETFHKGLLGYLLALEGEDPLGQLALPPDLLRPLLGPPIPAPSWTQTQFLVRGTSPTFLTPYGETIPIPIRRGRSPDPLDIFILTRAQPSRLGPDPVIKVPLWATVLPESVADTVGRSLADLRDAARRAGTSGVESLLDLAHEVTTSRLTQAAEELPARLRSASGDPVNLHSRALLYTLELRQLALLYQALGSGTGIDEALGASGVADRLRLYEKALKPRHGDSAYQHSFALLVSHMGPHLETAGFRLAGSSVLREDVRFDPPGGYRRVAVPVVRDALAEELPITLAGVLRLPFRRIMRFVEQLIVGDGAQWVKPVRVRFKALQEGAGGILEAVEVKEPVQPSLGIPVTPEPSSPYWEPVLALVDGLRELLQLAAEEFARLPEAVRSREGEGWARFQAGLSRYLGQAVERHGAVLSTTTRMVGNPLVASLTGFSIHRDLAPLTRHLYRQRTRPARVSLSVSLVDLFSRGEAIDVNLVGQTLRSAPTRPDYLSLRRREAHTVGPRAEARERDRAQRRSGWERQERERVEQARIGAAQRDKAERARQAREREAAERLRRTTEQSALERAIAQEEARRRADGAVIAHRRSQLEGHIRRLDTAVATLVELGELPQSASGTQEIELGGRPILLGPSIRGRVEGIETRYLEALDRPPTDQGATSPLPQEIRALDDRVRSDTAFVERLAEDALGKI